MVQVIVFTQNQVGLTDYHSAKLPQAGDVIDILPDDVDPGLGVRSDPRFLILSIPDATMNEMSGYKTREKATRKLAPLESEDDTSNMFQYRSMQLDIDGLVGRGNMKRSAAGGNEVVKVLAADVHGRAAKKAPIRDPRRFE